MGSPDEARAGQVGRDEWGWLDELRHRTLKMKSPSIVNEERKRLLSIIDRQADALRAIALETDNNTFGKPLYDMTLDHLHDVAVGGLGG